MLGSLVFDQLPRAAENYTGFVDLFLLISLVGRTKQLQSNTGINMYHFSAADAALLSRSMMAPKTKHGQSFADFPNMAKFRNARRAMPGDHVRVPRPTPDIPRTVFQTQAKHPTGMNGRKSNSLMGRPSKTTNMRIRRTQCTCFNHALKIR